MMTAKEKYKKYITKFTLKMTSAEFDLGQGYMKILSICEVN